MAPSAPPSTETMYHYLLFGGVLRSEVEIPELQSAPSSGEPRWTLRCIDGSAPDADGEHLGSDTVTGDVEVRMHRQGGGAFRMRFDDTGCFDISADGGTLTWYRPAEISMRDVRADLTSRVIAGALHATGTICLHGSAVVLDEVAIGLVAPKRHGKSTLALSLVRAGARLLTDDTMPVEPGDPPMAHAGLHATRLWSDSAERVGLGEALPVEDDKEKRLFSALPDDFVTHASAPLDGLYLLVPTKEPRDGEPVWRTRLSPIESALIMIGHTKLAPLLTKSEAPVLFQAAVRLAQSLPVYRLNVVRDMDRLPEVVETIRRWHEAAALVDEKVMVAV